MKMLGFTAEASLSTPVECYRQTMTFRAAVPDRVQPASCLSDCVGDCISGAGHPHPGVCIRFCRYYCRLP
jgi:hypothetical protein